MFDRISYVSIAIALVLVASGSENEVDAAFLSKSIVERQQHFSVIERKATSPTFGSTGHTGNQRRNDAVLQSLWAAARDGGIVEGTVSFIDSELRGAAMKLHTRQQAPKEGEAVDVERKPYVPTHDDYLAFLVDSKHVYEAFEEVVNENPELAAFRNTGLERTKGLEIDIEFMMKEYNLSRPSVGQYGLDYATKIKEIAAKGSIPEFICHYYNWYFAHTAGGRMIGKQMSALLLDKKTLEFYKWEGDLNEIKARVKQSIEEMAARWTQEEKDACTGGTMDAFAGGGAINSYLSVGK